MSSSPASPLIVCCPVCGSRRVDFPGSLVLGGCPDWVCPDCGARGFLSGRVSDESELVVCEWPGRSWCTSWPLMRRSLWDCVVPFVMPSDDADEVWRDASPRWLSGSRWRSVYAPSGVEVGYLYLDDGVWVCQNLMDKKGYGMLFEDEGDLRDFLAGGACGVVPAGSFVSL